jgi:DNA-binding transcriptional LysR family regulator
MNLNAQLLRTFCLVAEEGSFASAADRLHLTPSAVSGHIKRLEVAIGKQFIRRTTRRLQLTDDGELLHQYARSVITMEEAFFNRLRQGPDIARLRIGATEDFAASWLPRVLREFNRANSVGKLELKVGLTTDLIKQLDRGRLDIVFGKHCADEETSGALLWEEPLVWACASVDAIPATGSVALAVFPENCVYRRAAVDSLNAAKRSWTIAVESSSMAACLAATEAGLATTVIAQSQLRRSLRQLDTVDGMPKLPFVRFYAYVAKPSDQADSLVRAVRLLGKRQQFVMSQSNS